MRTYKYALKIVLPILLFNATAFAQVHNWTRSNPGGGGAFSTVGASASGIIIAGSDLSGAYRSQDHGTSWDVIGASKGLTETHVSGIGFHPTNGNILYIGTENGAFRSTDGGNSVTKVLNSGYITDIEFSNTNIGYIAYQTAWNSTIGKVYKSTDNGVSWSQISADLPIGIHILKILINPTNPDIVYILTGDGRFACGVADVFRSTNGGINWTNITTILPEILDMELDPNNSQNIFVTTMSASCSAPYYWTDLAGSLYKSTDGGTTWGTALSNYTGVIWIDAANSSTIRLIDPREPWSWIPTAGTYTSANGGTTFVKTGDVNTWDVFFNNLFWGYSSSYSGITMTLGKDLSNKNNYFWVNYQWIFATTDNGITFKNIFTNEVSSGFWKSRGFDNVNMMDISISKADPNIIYQAYFDIGLWRSLDHGETWQACNDVTHTGGWQGHGGDCASVIADPTRTNVVWATMSGNQQGQTPTYLLKSTNTGEKSSWVASNTNLPTTEVMGLSLDKNSPASNRILFVTAQSDIYKSIDDGGSWIKVFDCNGCRFTAVDQFNSNIVYGGGEKGLWRSLDGGANWANVSHVEMPTSSATFWNNSYNGIFDIKTDPNHANWVYVTAKGTSKGLYRSTDNGTNWQKLITDNYMRKVAIAPDNSNLLYATSSSAFQAGGYNSNSNGILFSSDAGLNWTPQNQGMAYPFAMSVEVDNLTLPNVFVGSPGTGFQRSLVPPSLPIFTAIATQATCGIGIARDDAKLSISAITNGDKVGYSIGSTYTGPAFVGASTIVGTSMDIVSNLPNPMGSAAYTIRVFNGADNYYTDHTISLAPQTCICPIICLPVKVRLSN